MKLKYLPQLLIIILTLGIYMVSAACGGGEEPTAIPPDVNDPKIALAETVLWGTEYARATEAGTEFARATDAAKTRQASGTPRTPTSSRTANIYTHRHAIQNTASSSVRITNRDRRPKRPHFELCGSQGDSRP